MPRFLGIDYGTKYIGLAVGDTDAGIASPIETIEPGDAVVDQIKAVLTVAREYGVDAFVVGLPLNMDDTEGEQAKITRRFGDALTQACGKPVHYWDERLSSHTAQELLGKSGLTRRKKKGVENSIAAQVILQSFLDTGGSSKDLE